MKTIHKTTLASIGAVLVSVLGSACATDEETPVDDQNVCDGAKCDGPLDVADSAVPASPCDGVMVDKSGRGNKKIAGRLNDPLANLVLKVGSDCPSTYKDILAKVRASEKAKCADPNQGLQTRLVSDIAQTSGKPAGMRGVVTRQCDGRDEHELIFSLFGLSPTMSALPPNVEIIAFDKTAGVYNYYEADGTGKINFFGNSKDMLKGPKANDVLRCAGCHTGGGLVMKELNSAWFNWEGDMDMPGADAFVTKFTKDLGTKSNGIDMESLVRSGNTTWNDTRVKFIKANMSTQELLKPLFCTNEINLGVASASTDVSFIPANVYIDQRLGGSGFSIDGKDYKAQIKANGQFVPGIAGKEDKAFGFSFVERSAIDMQYVDQLIAAGIIDDNLAKDVLMIDFTRSIFSTDRCDLVKKLPATKLTAAQQKPAGIRAALIKAMGTAPAAGSAAAELVKNLKDTKDDTKHQARVTAFEAACTALGSKKLTANALTYASLNRTTARTRQIMEFQETIVSDKLNVAAGTRLNPDTCELTTKFVPAK
jgi:hypothetical protein